MRRWGGITVAFVACGGCGLRDCGDPTFNPHDDRIAKNQLLATNIDQVRSAYAAGATQIDLDGDGIADWIVTRDGADIPRETIDLNHDGHPELVITRSAGTYTAQFDWNSDGAVDATKRVSTGQTLLLEQDITHPAAGTLDEKRVFTFIDGSGDVLVDRYSGNIADGSFTLDREMHTSALQPAVTVTTSGALACSARIDDALQAAQVDGFQCLAGLSTELAEQYLRTVVQSDVTVVCNDPNVPPQFAGTTDEAGALQCAVTPGACTVVISLTDSPNLSSTQLEQLAFHELLHASGLLHLLGDGTTDPDDPVYACARECFPALNSDGNTQPGDASRCIGEYCPANMIRTADGCEQNNFFPCAEETCDGGRFPQCSCRIDQYGGWCEFKDPAEDPSDPDASYACYRDTP